MVGIWWGVYRNTLNAWWRSTGSPLPPQTPQLVRSTVFSPQCRWTRGEISIVSQNNGPLPIAPPLLTNLQKLALAYSAWKQCVKVRKAVENSRNGRLWEKNSGFRNELIDYEHSKQTMANDFIASVYQHSEKSAWMVLSSCEFVDYFKVSWIFTFSFCYTWLVQWNCVLHLIDYFPLFFIINELVL